MPQHLRWLFVCIFPRDRISRAAWLTFGSVSFHTITAPSSPSKVPSSTPTSSPSEVSNTILDRQYHYHPSIRYRETRTMYRLTTARFHHVESNHISKWSAFKEPHQGGMYSTSFKLSLDRSTVCVCYTHDIRMPNPCVFSPQPAPQQGRHHHQPKWWGKRDCLDCLKGLHLCSCRSRFFLKTHHAFLSKKPYQPTSSPSTGPTSSPSKSPTNSVSQLCFGRAWTSLRALALLFLTLFDNVSFVSSPLYHQLLVERMAGVRTIQGAVLKLTWANVPVMLRLLVGWHWKATRSSKTHRKAEGCSRKNQKHQVHRRHQFLVLPPAHRPAPRGHRPIMWVRLRYDHCLFVIMRFHFGGAWYYEACSPVSAEIFIFDHYR